MLLSTDRILDKLDSFGINEYNFDEKISSFLKTDYFKLSHHFNSSRRKKNYDSDNSIKDSSYLGKYIEDIDLYNKLSRMEDNDYLKLAIDKSTKKEFEIFLSHSYTDRLFVFGLYLILTQDMNYTVYVDWLIDPYLSQNRSKTAKRNIRLLKLRMSSSRMMVLYETQNFSASKWIAWEVGRFDGQNAKVYLFDDRLSQTDYDKKGVSFLKIYDRIYLDHSTLRDKNGIDLKSI